MTGKELASYYRAAVEYIDPRLRDDCPVEDICAAAKARQHALRAHDSDTARLELEKIEEALQFIQRVHPDVVDICREQVTAEYAAEVEPALDLAHIAQSEPEVQDASQLVADFHAEEAIQPAVETDEASLVDNSVAAPAERDDYAGVLLSGTTADPAEDEMVELVLGSGSHFEAAVESATELETATADEPEPEAISIDFAAEPQVIQPESVLEIDDAIASSIDNEAEAESGDAGSELAAAMAASREHVEVPSRHQFIAELRERRLSSQHELAAEEAEQVISELREEQHSEERVSELISRVPDVSERMEQELQQEEQTSRPLDFRSLMSRAGANPSLKVRPASRPRLKTEEILGRERPARRIPEEHAAPILLGMLMILWQFSAALLAGFALSRALVWHFGTAFSSMTPIKALFTCLVGLGTAALIGAGFRYYRLRSHRLSLPVHVSALSIVMLLLSWQFSANANAYASGPPLWLWCMLFAAWLVATIAAGLHDLRVPPVSRDPESEVVAAKPAVPLAN
ncbi:MAG: YIP1 family protein [Planctomycetales bacterium]|nr:YIP1 family protein [bacterium]UNM09794.1 MAG: YIP1 family protein [Planctomycetales bacterium]